MSSIPVQFLVYIINPPSCGLAPVIHLLNVTSNVQIGVKVTLNISAATLCNPNVSRVDSIIISRGVGGMNVTNTTASPINASVAYVTFNWTPQIDQIGPQQLCVIAYSE